MSYAFNSYWYVALACAAVSFLIIGQYFISLFWKAYKDHIGRKRALKRMRNLKPGEPLEPQPEASSDRPAQAGVGTAPILENREGSEFPAAASVEPPVQSGAEAASILENREAFESQTSANLEPPASTGADVESNSEHPEPLEVKPEASPESQADAEVSLFDPRSAARLKLTIPHNRESLQVRQAPRLPSRVSAGSQPICENREAPEPEAPLNRDLLSQASNEVPLVVEQAAALEAQQAASLEPPAQAGIAAAPILANQEVSESQAAASMEPPTQPGAEAAPTLENQKAPEPAAPLNRDLLSQTSDEIPLVVEHAEALEAQEAAIIVEPPAQAGVAAAPILENREAPEPAVLVNRDLLSQASTEVPLIIEHAEALEAPQTAILQQPARVSAVLPILEDAKAPGLQQALRLEPPAQAGAEYPPTHERPESVEAQQAQPVLKSRGALESQTATSPELRSLAEVTVPPILEHRDPLAQSGAEVSSTFKHRELLEFQEVRANGYTAQNDQGRVTRDNKAIERDPKLAFPHSYEKRSLAKNEASDKVDADVDLAPEAIQAGDSEYHAELGQIAEALDQLARANGKEAGALRPKKESTSEGQSATNEDGADKGGGLDVNLQLVTERAAQPRDKVNADSDSAASEAIQIRDSEYYAKLGEIAVALDQLAAVNGKKAAALRPNKQSTLEGQWAAIEKRADKGRPDVSLRQMTEGAVPSGDKVDAGAELAAPEAIQARDSGNDVKLDQLAAANGKIVGAPMPKVESPSQDRSVAIGADKGWLGMSLRQVTEGAAETLNVRPDYGALVAKLSENSPAKPAGIEPGDIVISFDDKDIKDWRELPRIVADTPAGKEVVVTIIRKGKELTKMVKVGRPDDSEKPMSFISTEQSIPQENPTRKKALGFDRAAPATLGRVTFGRRKAMAVSQ